MILFKDLPREDTRRNTPLKELDAEIRNWKSKNWRKIKTWKIGKFCYNDLSAENWLTFNEFRIPEKEVIGMAEEKKETTKKKEETTTDPQGGSTTKKETETTKKE